MLEPAQEDGQQEVRLGESNKVILAAQSGHAVAIARIVCTDSSWIEANELEALVLSASDALSNCMLVGHEYSNILGCLLSLSPAPGGNGLALGHGGLQLASRAGSEASTVMSARRCPLFLSTIGCAVEMANRQLRQMYPDRHDDWIQIRRFHVLREDFSVANGMLVPSKAINRPKVISRFSHIVDDMFRYDLVVDPPPPSALDSAAAADVLPQATSLGPSQAPLRPLDWAHHEATAGSARDGGAAFDTLSTDGGASDPGWQAGHLPPYAHSTPVVSQGEHGSAGDDKGSDGIAVRRGNIESLLHAQRMALASSYPSSREAGHQTTAGTVGLRRQIASPAISPRYLRAASPKQRSPGPDRAAWGQPAPAPMGASAPARPETDADDAPAKPINPAAPSVAHAWSRAARHDGGTAAAIQVGGEAVPAQPRAPGAQQGRQESVKDWMSAVATAGPRVQHATSQPPPPPEPHDAARKRSEVGDVWDRTRQFMALDFSGLESRFFRCEDARKDTPHRSPRPSAPGERAAQVAAFRSDLGLHLSSA